MSTIPDYWQAVRGAWVNKQNTLICQQSDQTAQIVMGSSGWTDMQVQATVLWSSGAAGVVGRYASSNAGYYSWTIYPQSSIMRLELVSSNLFRVPLASYSSVPGISVAQDFIVKLDIQGSSLRGYVNDVQYASVTDSTLSAGMVGLDWQQGQGQFHDMNVNVKLPDGTISPVTFPTEFGMYTSPDDVKSLLQGIPLADIATDDDIANYIKQASDMINRETYSSFGRGVRVEERYDGSGQFTLVLNHSPIVKLHSLKIMNPNNVVIRTWSESDAEDTGSLIVEPNIGTLTIPGQFLVPQLLGTTYSLWPTVNPLMGTEAQGVQYDYFNRFGRGNRNILVSYEYGYQQVPEVIRWACAKSVASLLLIKRGHKDTGGATDISMEGLTINFQHRQGISAPYGSTVELWNKEIQDAVRQYRRRPVPMA